MSRTLRNGLIVLCAVAVAVLPLLSHGFIITLMNYIGIYTLITLGLVLLTGCGGITSFGQAAFVGIGAYATAYLTTAMGWSPWLGLLAGIVLTSLRSPRARLHHLASWWTLSSAHHHRLGCCDLSELRQFRGRSAPTAASRTFRRSRCSASSSMSRASSITLSGCSAASLCSALPISFVRGRDVPSAPFAAAKVCRKVSASTCSGCGSACSSSRPRSRALPAGCLRI